MSADGQISVCLSLTYSLLQVADEHMRAEAELETNERLAQTAEAEIDDVFDFFEGADGAHSEGADGSNGGTARKSETWRRDWAVREGLCDFIFRRMPCEYVSTPSSFRQDQAQVCEPGCVSQPEPESAHGHAGAPNRPRPAARAQDQE